MIDLLGQTILQCVCVDAAAGDVDHAALSRGTAHGDYDNDGDVDLLVFNLDDAPTLLRNDGGNQRNWLTLYLRGTASNRDGIGAKITVSTGDIVQTVELISGGSFLSHSDPRAHFGLGFYQRAHAEIRWPSGQVQHLEDLAANQLLTVVEPSP